MKPENILLDRMGRVKVADFGLARLMQIQTETPARPTGGQGVLSLTEAGKIMGTPQYMAPEQVNNPTEVDHRADIYSLGVVFYQMLTGELPGKKIEPPSRKVHIDVRLDEIVLHAPEKEPERRYQRACEMKTDVETMAPGPEASGSQSGNKSQSESFDLRSWRILWYGVVMSAVGLPLGLLLGMRWLSLVSLIGVLAGIYKLIARGWRMRGLPDRWWPARTGVSWPRSLLFAYALFLAGTAGAWLFTTLLGHRDQALIFTFVTLALALGLGVLSRRHWLGKGVVIGSLLVLVVLAVSPSRNQQREQDFGAVFEGRNAATAEGSAAEDSRRGFGPVVERLFSGTQGYLDLDSGKILAPPADLRGGNAIREWAKASGVDGGVWLATVDDHVVDGAFDEIDLLTASADERAWERMTAEELRETLANEIRRSGQARPSMGLLKSRNERGQNVVWVFETREGSLGLLQVIGLSDAPRGIRLRYRLVQRGRPIRPRACGWSVRRAGSSFPRATRFGSTAASSTPQANMEVSETIQCPYCGQSFELVVDTKGPCCFGPLNEATAIPRTGTYPRLQGI